MRRIGPYVIERELARGGQGVVASARDARDGRPVALKVLLDATDPVAAARFAQEAHVLSSLDHPSLVRVLGHGVERGLPYLAMELVVGEDLGARVRRDGPPSPAWTALTLAAVARALAACHAAGVTHRDVKPQNIIVEAGTDRPVLVDFGLLKRDPARVSSESTRLSLSGEVMGTPSFMPPEQADPGGTFGPVGPPADVYALGATLYALLTGEPPFAGAAVLSVLAAVLEKAPRPPRALAPSTPPELEALCLHALAKQPAERPTAAAFAAALERFARAGRRRTRRRPLGAIGVGVAALAVAAGALALRGRGPDAPAPAPPPTPAPAIAPVERTPPPWPALAPGWRAAWRLEDGGAAAQEPALWTDADTAAPLEAVLRGEPRALAAAYAGRASARAGIVSVRYGLDAVRSWRFPGHALTTARDPGPLVGSAGEDGVDLHSLNDAGVFFATVGDARWVTPRLRCSISEVEPVDMRQLILSWAPLAGSGPGLAWTGRRASLEAMGALARLELDRTPRALEFAPWAPAGARVRYEGRAISDLDSALADAAPSRAVSLVISGAEIHVTLEALEVSGTPARVDRPALASPTAPLPRWSQARVAGAFAGRPGPGAGPVLALGGAEAELIADRLILRVDGVVAAAVPVEAAGDGGWITLERRGPVLRAQVAAGGATVTLALADPASEPGGPAAWGSSGPRIRWRDVEVALGPDAPATPSEAGWRDASAMLARLASPRAFDAALHGNTAWHAAARADLAARAASGLVAATAGDLEPAVLRDALARAVLAALLAHDVPLATSALQRLRGEAGDAGARAAVDGLVRMHDGKPIALDQLAAGWYGVDRVADRAAHAAVLTVALELVAPARRGEVLVSLANAAREEQRLDEALRRYAEAEEAGVPRGALAASRGKTLMLMRRFDESLEAFDLAVVHDAKQYWSWLGRAQLLAQMGRLDAALESALVSLALGPQARQLVADLARDRVTPITLVARQVLGAQPAQTLAAARGLRPASPRDQDLLAYVLGEEPPGGDRPTRALALAARRDAAARAALPSSPDPLVRHLVALDARLR